MRTIVGYPIHYNHDAGGGAVVKLAALIIAVHDDESVSLVCWKRGGSQHTHTNVARGNAAGQWQQIDHAVAELEVNPVGPDGGAGERSRPASGDDLQMNAAPPASTSAPGPTAEPESDRGPRQGTISR